MFIRITITSVRLPGVKEMPHDECNKRYHALYERRFPASPAAEATPPKRPRRARPAAAPIPPALLDQVAQRYPHTFAPASPEALELLRKAQWPAALVGFYAAGEPRYSGPRSARLRLYSIEQIFAHMEAFEPAATLAPFGYAPLAENASGDMYLYNLHTIGPEGWPEIVFASHEHFSGEETQADAEELLGEAASSLPEFLQKVAQGTLEE